MLSNPGTKINKIRKEKKPTNKIIEFQEKHKFLDYPAYRLNSNYNHIPFLLMHVII